MSQQHQLRSTVASRSPCVSIGMPVYNGAKFIRSALDSLLAQTFANFEVIISDNASTDDTEAICREYAARDGRIRYVRQDENKGAVFNFRYVLDEAVGDYFLWAAHDDMRHPAALERMLEVFDQNEDVGLVFSNMSSLDFKSGSISTHVVGYIPPATRKIKKYLFRLTNDCASLIYGLHKTPLLKTFPFGNYDFMDIHLAHWYELNSAIMVVPLDLYTAGTDGARVPYSVSSQGISPKEYYLAEWRLLHSHFGFAGAITLYLIAVYLMRKNLKHLQH